MVDAYAAAVAVSAVLEGIVVAGGGVEPLKAITGWSTGLKHLHHRVIDVLGIV